MSRARPVFALPGDRLIVGLGNPGRRYHGTRHNVGLWVVEELAHRASARFRAAGGLRVASTPIPGGRLTLAKPVTFMNLSGEGLALWVNSRRFPLDAVLVIHDDLDLPAGRVRLRRSGSAGGHRGVQSVIDRLGSDEFARLKIGIGRPPEGVDPVDYVLRRPDGEQLRALEQAVALACDACGVWVADGIERAMNLYNSGPGSGTSAGSAPGTGAGPLSGQADSKAEPRR